MSVPPAPKSLIEIAYDPSVFRESATTAVNRLCEHLDQAISGDGNVLNWKVPVENHRLAARFLNESQPKLTKSELLQRIQTAADAVLQNGHNLHNPRYIGHQVPASIPAAGVFTFVTHVMNQVMAIYEMGPFITGVEQAVIEKFGSLVGWEPDSFTGLTTNGGSLANLTALLTARNEVLGDSWKHGTSRGEGANAVLVTHADSHYCVPRSAGILGLGTDSVVKAALDDRRRMDPEQLDQTLTELRHNNKTIVAVNACACATHIGAFDDLSEIAAVCQKHHVWLHVDAAHGGAVLFSDKHRHLLNGIDQADSFICDAHKMLFVPALCAFVFYRNRKHRYVAFQQDAPYLFDPTAPDLADVDSGLCTFECTKQALALPFWGIWSSFGSELFSEIVDTTFERCRSLYEKMAVHLDFHPFHEPQANILAFRYHPVRLKEADPSVISKLNFSIRRKIIESGRFYIVPFQLDGIGGIRTTVMNPLTTDDHLDELIEEISRVGEELISNGDFQSLR